VVTVAVVVVVVMVVVGGSVPLEAWGQQVLSSPLFPPVPLTHIRVVGERVGSGIGQLLGMLDVAQQGVPTLGVRRPSLAQRLEPVAPGRAVAKEEKGLARQSITCKCRRPGNKGGR
jgi:hypothetical protein